MADLGAGARGPWPPPLWEEAPTPGTIKDFDIPCLVFAHHERKTPQIQLRLPPTSKPGSAPGFLAFKETQDRSWAFEKNRDYSQDVPVFSNSVGRACFGHPTCA